MMVGGPEGSTAGMRFNPRESAEELQDDSNVVVKIPKSVQFMMRRSVRSKKSAPK